MTSESARRWRFPVLLAVGAGVFLVWVWLLSGQIRQMQMIFTYAAAIVVAVAGLVWLVVFSGLRGGARWAPVAVAALAVVAFFSLLRIRGVTGDWLPVLEWRFAGGDGWRGGAVQGPGALAGRSDPDWDFPRFLGPQADSTVHGTRLARDWEAQPPELVWKRPVGAGWSGFAVAGGVAYTMEQRGDEETVVAYALETGEEIWSHGYRSLFSNPIAGPGPRATPTIGREGLFTFGATGILSAFDPRTGRLLWQRDVVAEHGATIPDHGKTSSPLLVDGLVVVSAGGGDGHSLVAYHRATGEPAWHGGSDGSGYGSPTLALLAGRRQILSFNRSSVAGHDPRTGEVLWQHPWPKDWPNVAPPVVVDGERVMFSTGYGIGSKLLRVRETAEGGLAAELVWESPRMKAKFANLVLHAGFVYGLDDGVLVCLDPETGERRWKRGRYGHGNVLLAGDLLLVQTEKGDIVLVEPTPEEHRELGRFTALPGKAWNPMALAGPYLLMRNDQEAALWRLPERGRSES